MPDMGWECPQYPLPPPLPPALHLPFLEQTPVEICPREEGMFARPPTSGNCLFQVERVLLANIVTSDRFGGGPACPGCQGDPRPPRMIHLSIHLLFLTPATTPKWSCESMVNIM